MFPRRRLFFGSAPYSPRPASQWLDIWLDAYCRNLKPMTLASYKSKIEGRIKPAIGGSYLSALTNVQLQTFYNSLSDGGRAAVRQNDSMLSRNHSQVA